LQRWKNKTDPIVACIRKLKIVIAIVVRDGAKIVAARVAMGATW